MKKNKTASKAKAQEEFDDKLFYNTWGIELPPALTAEDNKALFMEYRRTGDKKLKQKIFYGNLRLVASFVRDIGNYVINKDSQIYPSWADVAQECAIKMFSVIDKYNPDRDGVGAFSNVLYRSLTNVVASMNRRYNTERAMNSSRTTSLQEALCDTQHLDKLNTISNERNEEDYALAYAELEYIKDSILPSLKPKEKKFFEDFYFKNLSICDIARENNISRCFADRILLSAVGKVGMIYYGGREVFEAYEKIDKNFRDWKTRRYLKNYEILKRYDKQLLETLYLPTLTEQKQKVFKRAVLEYDGAMAQDVAKQLKISVEVLRKYVLELDMNVHAKLPQLLEKAEIAQPVETSPKTGSAKTQTKEPKSLA